MKASELTNQLLAEGCNPQNFSVLSRKQDAYCIDKSGKQWKVFYSERGCDFEPIFTSNNESEACEFFYNLIIKQQHWHLVGFFKDEADAKALKEKLSALGINTIRNDIPAYKTANDPRYRVFVVGNDIFRVKAQLSEIDIKFE
jgi:hypothetical protein